MSEFIEQETPTIKSLVYESTKQDFHTGKGFSSAGEPIGRIALKKYYGNRNTEDLNGIFMVGKLIHKYFQEVIFPDGKYFKELEFTATYCPGKGEDKKPLPEVVESFKIEEFEVFGHEQKVPTIIKDELFYSSIDTELLKPETKEMYLVDYKSMNPMAYLYLTAPKPKDISQLSIYGNIRSSMLWEAGIVIKGLILIYINKNNWMDTKAFFIDYNEEMGNSVYSQLIQRKEYEDLIKSGIPIDEILTKTPFEELVPCVKDTKYCNTYCRYQPECLEIFRKSFNQRKIEYKKLETHNDVRKILKKEGKK